MPLLLVLLSSLCNTQLWGIPCIVSLSFSTLRARKAVSFFKDCCGLIHCDSSSFSTECCVSGKLCAHISVACKLQKGKGTSASLTQLLLFFLTTHLLDLNLLIEVFHILLGMFNIFRDYNSQVCLMGISHVCYSLWLFVVLYLYLLGHKQYKLSLSKVMIIQSEQLLERLAARMETN